MNCIHQGPLYMGFPRQEYWSGLPFPFPGNLLNPGTAPTSLALQVASLPLSRRGSPNTDLVCFVAQPCQTLYNPMDYSLPGSSVHGDSPGKNTGVEWSVRNTEDPPGDLPDTGIEPRSPALQADSLLS